LPKESELVFSAFIDTFYSFNSQVNLLSKTPSKIAMEMFDKKTKGSLRNTIILLAASSLIYTRPEDNKQKVKWLDEINTFHSKLVATIF
jgi:hypothetical protein